MGLFLGLLSLGIGFMWAFFSRYRQTWADLLSHSYIVERNSKTLIATGNQDSNVFTAGILLGNFKEVPAEYRVFSTLLDLIIISLLWNLGIALANIERAQQHLFAPIILQAESCKLDGYYLKRSYHSSGGAFAYARRTHPGPHLSSTFSGPSGVYDVRVAFWGSSSYSSEVQLQIGNNKAAYDSFGHDSLRRIPIFKGIAIANGDPIVVSSSAGPNRHEKIDYLEISPSGSQTFLGQDNLGRFYRIVFYLGLCDFSALTHACACLVLYIIFYFAAISMSGTTFGSLIMGFRIGRRNAPEQHPSFLNTAWRAAGLVEHQFLYFLGFLSPFTVKGTLLELSNTKVFFSRGST